MVVVAVATGLLLSTVMEPPEDQSIFEKIVANVTQEELDFMKIFGIDDGDGTIDNKEFIILTVVRIGAAPPHLITQINERFRMLDRKREGRISYDDLVFGRKKKITRQQSFKMVLSRTMSSSGMIMRQVSGTSGRLVRQMSGIAKHLARSTSNASIDADEKESQTDRPAPRLGGGVAPPPRPMPRQLSSGFSRGISAITLHSMSSAGSSPASSSLPSPKGSPRGHKMGRVLPVDPPCAPLREVEKQTSDVEDFVNPGSDSESDTSIISETCRQEEAVRRSGSDSVMKQKPVGSLYLSPQESSARGKEVEETKEGNIAIASIQAHDIAKTLKACSASGSQRLSPSAGMPGKSGVGAGDMNIQDVQGGGSSSSSDDDDYFDEEAQAKYNKAQQERALPPPSAEPTAAESGREAENSFRTSSVRRVRASVLAIEKMKAADSIHQLKSNVSSLTLPQKISSRVKILVTDPYFQSFLAW
jgi:hypothetical protein